MRTFLSESFPDLWLLAQGGMLVLVVMFLPMGVTGLIRSLIQKLMLPRTV